MNNIVLRALSGAVYVALIVAGIMVNNLTLLLLGMLLCLLGITELQQIAPKGAPRLRGAVRCLDCIGGLLMVTGGFLLGDGRVAVWQLALLAGFYVCYMIVRFVTELYRGGQKPMSALAFSMLSQGYVALPLALMCWLGGVSRWLVLAMFIFIWMNDTGAFLVGSRIGRRKLFERLSPKKSWEGFWGGMAVSALSAVVMAYCFPAQFNFMPTWGLIVYAAAMSVFATWGDLVESMFKRALHVKDSGAIIPGHGGILDRIDSLLLVAPATASIVIFTKIISYLI